MWDQQRIPLGETLSAGKIMLAERENILHSKEACRKSREGESLGYRLKKKTKKPASSSVGMEHSNKKR